MSDKEKKPKAEKVDMPESITLIRPHGFIEEETGNHRYWLAGIVTDPEDIALLISRGAEIE